MNDDEQHRKLIATRRPDGGYKFYVIAKKSERVLVEDLRKAASALAKEYKLKAIEIHIVLGDTAHDHH